MNPYVMLGAGLVWAASVAGAYHYGGVHTRDAMDAAEARDIALVRDVREKAEQGAADAIAKNRPIYRTIKQEAVREHTTETIYADCRLPASGVRRINAATTAGRPVSAGDSQLPTPGSDSGGQ